MVAQVEVTNAQTMTLEEYLTMSFPDSETEPEFVRDHLEEKAMPDDTHSAVQSYLGHLALDAARKIGRKIYVRTELRVRMKATVRLPDLVIYLDSSPNKPGLITQPPFAAFEISSPDQKLTSMLDKLEEYREWGVPNIFFVATPHRQLYRFTAKGLLIIDAIELPEIGLRATITDIMEGV